MKLAWWFLITVVLVLFAAYCAQAEPLPDAPSFAARQQVQLPPNCRWEGQWKLCNDDGRPMRSQDGITWKKEKPKRVADAKFWAVAAVPHVLNLAYRFKFGSCYPTRCVEKTGLSPNAFYALFTGIDASFNVLGYFAKKQKRKEWAVYAVSPVGTFVHVYDLQHNP